MLEEAAQAEKRKLREEELARARAAELQVRFVGADGVLDCEIVIYISSNGSLFIMFQSFVLSINPFIRSFF